MGRSNAGDPLAALRPRLRRAKLRILVYTLCVESVRWLRSDAAYRRWVAERWGRYAGGAPEGCLWIHAHSIGETKTAVSLAKALPPGLPLVITTHTLRSAQAARADLGGWRATVVPTPVIFTWVMRRFLRRFAPQRVLLIEGTSLFLPLLTAALRLSLPVAVVNGWFLRRQIPAMRAFLPFLRSVQVFGVRHAEDRETLLELGIPAARIGVTGDLKFDAAPAKPLGVLGEQLRELAGGRPILLAGSTHRGEDSVVLDAFEQLGGGGRALLILAPRHPRAIGEAEELLRRRQIDYCKRSQLPCPGRPAAVLLDRIGELASLYRLAAAAFVGGSLVPEVGGHNPLEAASAALPIAVGPHMDNFRFVAEIFDRAGAWRRVADAGDLAAAWAGWLDDPTVAGGLGERAAELLAEHRGALDRTLALLRGFLGGETASGDAGRGDPGG